jgi:hypothetical protein
MTMIANIPYILDGKHHPYTEESERERERERERESDGEFAFRLAGTAEATMVVSGRIVFLTEFVIVFDESKLDII